MRTAYHEQLSALTEHLGEMCGLSGRAMEHATQALLQADLVLAEQVITDHDQIVAMSHQAEENAFVLLALQAPVAGDLRSIVSSIQIVADIDRMGALALHVAKIARRRHPQHALPEEVNGYFAEMGRLAVELGNSAQEVLRGKDFAKLTPEELAEVRRMIQTTAWELAQYRARRRAPTPRRLALDMRRTLRQNLRYGCEPLTLAWRGPKLKRRPLVVICDVSGSMEHYSRLLLKFVYVLGNCLDKVEAFVFSTRLTRITRELQCGDVDASLDQVAATIQDWGSGTRLGEALKTFNFEWGRRLLSRGAVVLLVSDGLDRGDIDLLEREMQRLQLCCHRLIWLNPLLGSTDYRPLARGMRAALPYVDDFLPVHNLASLEHLARVLERLGRTPSGAPFRV